MNGVKIVSDFDIVSFFVAIAVAFYTFTKYSERNVGNKSFKQMVFCSALLCAADYFACLSVKLRAGSSAETLLFSLCAFFYAAFSKSALNYVNAYIYGDNKIKKDLNISIKILLPLFVAALAANYFTGFIFYIDDDFSLVRGRAGVALPLISAYFAFRAAIQIGRFAQKFTKQQLAVLCLFVEASIVSPFLQVFVFPTFRIAPFICVFFITTLLLTIETPDDQALIATISELEDLQRALKASVEKKTVEARERREKLERLTMQMMYALAETIDAKDRYTSGHSARVARYSKMLAQKKGLSPEKCQQIFMMGLLHDIGKVGVPTKILNKEGALTEREFSQIKAHPAIGSSISEKVSLLPELRTGARWHHERVDGRGYPDGLNGKQIPLEAKIIAVADAYDAMTSSRSYRPRMEQAAVREQISNGMGSQFDNEIASLMIELIDEDKRYNLREYKRTAEAAL